MIIPKILFSMAALMASAEDFVGHTVDIDFARRLEVTRVDRVYELKECLRDKCRPLAERPKLTVDEAKALLARADAERGRVGVGTYQFLFDLARNLDAEGNPQSKVVVGKVVAGESKSVLYYLRPEQDIVAVLRERRKAAPVTSVGDFVLAKACDEGQCRAFTGSPQEYEELATQIKGRLRGKSK